MDSHFFGKSAVGLPVYFRRLRLFGRFGQLIKSIFAAISTSSDLIPLALLDDFDVPPFIVVDLGATP